MNDLLQFVLDEAADQMQALDGEPVICFKGLNGRGNRATLGDASMLAVAEPWESRTAAMMADWWASNATKGRRTCRMPCLERRK